MSATTTTTTTPRLTVICGPMFAGKTRMLIDIYGTKAEATRIAIKPTIDTRYAASRIVAHSGESIPAAALNNLQLVEQVAGRPECANVFIDEGQFFMDLAERTAALLALGKSVWIAGLNATAQQRPWPSMSDVMAMADDLVHVKTRLCHACGDAPGAHTIMHAAPPAPAAAGPAPATTIRIGGDDMYVAVCRACMVRHWQAALQAPSN
jgi:thymidine kinase